MTLNYENDGIFLIMGNAGFITSTVRVICFGGPMLYIYSFLLSSTAVHVNANAWYPENPIPLNEGIS